MKVNEKSAISDKEPENHQDVASLLKIKEKLAISIKELQKISGLGRTTIYKAISQKTLKIIKIGKRTLIPMPEVIEFLSIEK